MKPIIEFQDYSYFYPKEEEAAIKNISVTINQGEFVGIIGRNKAGKSTACLSMIGIAPHTIGGDWIGNVIVNGILLDESTVGTITNHVGVVFQDAESQFTQETVEDEIAFAMCNMGIERTEMLNRVKKVAKDCNLTDFLDRSPFQLSGGQQQRLAVACLLALKPEVVILDESTSQLDPIGRDEIFSLVSKLHQLGRTVVMVDHNIEKIAQYTSKIMVLFDGEVKLYGDTREILQQKELLNQYHIRLPQVTDAAYGLKEEKGFTTLPITLDEAVGAFSNEDKKGGDISGASYSNEKSCS
ncbi:energy-coupling factor ABC transporter ATP-binding protein [Evansella tamaricis]|uniref:ATP-binding cassette domain-containing protein n=1 Tax=Evansella tamaricis TaxID=2069301 RepID=A0ABS6JA09_9BACI|nr:ATP-binding cassette domain-containing protein [Evansella tamaricis]MBU9710517.1 ATP-binding cassette domain-containing protein [Evansella tamaricis]